MCHDQGRTPSALSASLGWIFSVAVAAYAVAIHHGLGPAAKGIALRWYEPRAFLLDVDLISFMFDSSVGALVYLTIPALLLAAGVFASSRSAVARGVALSCVLATMLFVFYGVSAPYPWAFFGWRGSAVLWLIAISVGFAAAAPFLAQSWLRLGWPLRTAVYLPFAFGVIAFICNATGTDPKLKYSISPWPAVPVFGIEVGGLFVALGLVGVAIAIGGLAMAPIRSTRIATAARPAAILLGVLVPTALLGVGGRLGVLPFELGARVMLGMAAACALAIAAAATLRLSQSGEALRRRARGIAVGAALVGLPLIAGQALARLDYYVTREHRARQIIDALNRYAERESLFPDDLEQLVAAGDIDEIPSPAIGFGFLHDASFRYQGFGTSFLLEFSAPRWVECAYNPPYDGEREAAGAEDEEPDDWRATPGADDESLGEAWSCPDEPPELW